MGLVMFLRTIFVLTCILLSCQMCEAQLLKRFRCHKAKSCCAQTASCQAKMCQTTPSRPEVYTTPVPKTYCCYNACGDYCCGPDGDPFCSNFCSQPCSTSGPRKVIRVETSRSISRYTGNPELKRLYDCEARQEYQCDGGGYYWAYGYGPTRSSAYNDMVAFANRYCDGTVTFIGGVEYDCR